MKWREEECWFNFLFTQTLIRNDVKKKKNANSQNTSGRDEMIGHGLDWRDGTCLEISKIKTEESAL